MEPTTFCRRNRMRPSLKSINHNITCLLSTINTQSGRRSCHQPGSRLGSPDQPWSGDPECLRLFPETLSHCSCWWRNQRDFTFSSCRSVTTVMTPNCSDVWKIPEEFTLWNQGSSATAPTFTDFYKHTRPDDRVFQQTQPIIIQQVHLKLEMIFQFHLFQHPAGTGETKCQLLTFLILPSVKWRSQSGFSDTVASCPSRLD